MTHTIYTVAVENSVKKLNYSVLELLADNWEIAGGISYANKEGIKQYMQALIKKVDEDEFYRVLRVSSYNQE